MMFNYNLLGEGSNGVETSLTNEDTVTHTEDNLTKSHEWITLASTQGWTASNTADLSIGCLYLLHGSPEKVNILTLQPTLIIY